MCRHRLQRTARSLVALLACLLPPALAFAQDPAAGRLLPVLDELARQADVFRTSIPNFTCDESIHAEASRNGHARKLADTTGTFRVVRGEGATWPRESRLVTQENGHPLRDADKARLPVILTGVFGRVLSLYFDPGRRACFRFSLDAQRLSFEAVPGVVTTPACTEVAPGTTGFALLDSTTGLVLHIERTVPDAVAQTTPFAAFTAVDFTPLEKNGHTYQLPAHVRGAIPRGSSLYTFDAHYSDCRLFTGAVTLLPDNVVQTP